MKRKTAFSMLLGCCLAGLFSLPEIAIQAETAGLPGDSGLIPPTPVHKWVVSDKPTTTAGDYKLFVASLVEKDESTSVSIDVQIPHLKTTSETLSRRFNAPLEAKFEKEISSVQEMARENRKLEAFVEASGRIREGRQSRPPFHAQMFVRFTTALADPHLLSLRLDIEHSFDPRTHPNHQIEVLNYDLDKGRLLKLSDLFRPGSDYLSALSEYCIADLRTNVEDWRERPDDHSWEKGALPKAENYTRWNLTKTGLRILFQEYEVASYAAGPQTVDIPWSVLKDLLDPAGPGPRLDGSAP